MFVILCRQMICDGPSPAPGVLLNGLICEVLKGGGGGGGGWGGGGWMAGRVNVMNVV